MRPPRIGLLVPSTNTTVERDFQHLGAGCASFHSQRMRVPDGTMTAELLDQMNAELASDIRCLATADVDVVAYACTSGTFVKGSAWDAAVVEDIRAISGKPAAAASPSVVAALRSLEARRISVATPYPDWTNERLKAYLEANGFEVLSIASDPRAAAGGHRSINDQAPEEIAEFAVRTAHPEADAIFCSCTAWRSLEAADRIEQASGRPVVTSNQALLWASLRQAGAARPLAAGGKLLRELHA